MTGGARARDMLGRGALASVRAARESLESDLKPIDRVEEVDLRDALGRVTAAAIQAPESLPTHDRSVMDGYALRAADTFGATESLPAYLDVTGEVHMGEAPGQGPAPGACFRIATGGWLPPGTDAVVMLEQTVTVDARMIEVLRPVAVGENVIARGDDVTEGERILGAGCRLRPQDLGLLAGLGIRRVPVRPRTRVAIVSTGDEVVPFEEDPPPGRVRDINAVNLEALVRSDGGVPVVAGIIADDEAALAPVLRRAVADTGLVLVSGGSSVGVRDLGERVIGGLGEPGILVHGVAVKPGKPVILARAGEVPVIGLPGHPAAVSVAYDLFVRPVLRILSGEGPSELPERRHLRAVLSRNVASAPGRTDIIRVRVRRDAAGRYAAEPLLGKSSGLATLVRADGAVIVPESKQGLRAGVEVDVELYPR